MAGLEQPGREPDDDHPGQQHGEGRGGGERPAEAARLEPGDRGEQRPGAGREQHGEEHPARRRMVHQARPLHPGEGREGREAGELDPPGAVERQRAHAATFLPGALRSPAAG